MKSLCLPLLLTFAFELFEAGPMIECPKYGARPDPASHGDLVFDGQVWCDRCYEYNRELIRPREIQEIESWCHMISTAFGLPPVHIEKTPILAFIGWRPRGSWRKQTTGSGPSDFILRDADYPPSAMNWRIFIPAKTTPGSGPKCLPCWRPG
jgi:hypothetical protein